MLFYQLPDTLQVVIAAGLAVLSIYFLCRALTGIWEMVTTDTKPATPTPQQILLGQFRVLFPGMHEIKEHGYPNTRLYLAYSRPEDVMFRVSIDGLRVEWKTGLDWSLFSGHVWFGIPLPAPLFNRLVSETGITK